jgi:AAA15 family ATPase/GTPase
MKMLNYKYWSSGDDRWEISDIELKKLNLVVGDSGSGKTRFLNTFFNLGRFATGTKKSGDGCWKVRFEINGSFYSWEIENRIKENGEWFVDRELLIDESKKNGPPIIERTSDSFQFNGEKIPKLKKDSSSIELLEDEELVKPIKEGFGNILRRNFSSDELDRAVRLEMITNDLLDQDIQTIFHRDVGLNIKLYYLSEKNPTLFKSICDRFLEIFPFVRNYKMHTLKDYKSNFPAPGLFPILSIKEKNVDIWIPLERFSSGMQKVLLLITDCHFFPESSICLIDEYENSLGINAINFFPTYLSEIDKDIQFIITSHHPYIINSIPANNWLVFHRKGHQVIVQYGDKNLERFGKSKQQRFIQLVNDPFYLEGVE